MIKNQLFISLLLLFTFHEARGRFLQGNTGPMGRDLQTTTTTTYRTNLLCGECILGGYNYCVKGAEGLIVDTAPTGYCCKDTATCLYVKDAAWNCSSKYNTTVDKIKVCPFIKNQCGSTSDLSLTGIQDQQCIKIKSLQSGNACLYKVSSKCAVPNFQLNDTTNVVIQYQMISNKTIDYSSSSTGSCPALSVNQSCFCQNITINGTLRLSCNCSSLQNGAVSRNLTLSNTSCSCAAGNATQTNRSCFCCVSSTSNDTTQLSGSSVQACTSIQSCQCVNVTNATTKTWSYNCSCRSAKTNVTVSNIAIGNSSCSCSNLTANTTSNATSTRSCNCCVSSNVVEQQALPVCSNGTQRQSCSCSNVTNGTSWIYRCNCTSASNVVSSNQNISQSNCFCFNTTTVGNTTLRQCDCCVTVTSTKASRLLLIAPPTINNTSTNTSSGSNTTTNVTRTNTTTNTSNGTVSSIISTNSGPAATQVVTVVTSCLANCSCVNQTNVTTKVSTWNCSCNTTNSTNRTQVITQRGLIYNATQCSLKGTLYSCCSNTTVVTNVTVPVTPTVTFVNVTTCLSSCSCVNQTNLTTRVSTWNCSCNTTNSTNRTQVITTRGLIFNATQCSVNGTNYNCCVTTLTPVQTSTPPTPSTPSITTVFTNVTNCLNNCSCVSQLNATTKVSTWNCSCNTTNSTNRTQVITNRGLIFNATQCTLNGTNYNCCVTTLVATNVTVQPNNTTPSQNQTQFQWVVSFVNETSCLTNCSCVSQTNITTKVVSWNCSCNSTNSTNRTQVITTRGLIFNASQCSLSGTNYNCCVTALVTKNVSVPVNNPTTPTQTVTFVNVTSCLNNCSCVNQTNATTRVTTWNCTCNSTNSTNRTQVVTTRGLIFNASQCSVNGTNYNCCVTTLTAVQTNTPTTPTTPTTTTVFTNVTNCLSSCSCVNQTNITTRVSTWNCSCNTTNSTNRTQVITTRGLIFNASQCSLNRTNFNCCVTTVVATNVTVQPNQTTPSTPSTPVFVNVTTCLTNCSCLNQTNAVTRVTTWNCSCNTTNSTNRTQVITTRGLIFNATQCQLNGTNYNCCVTSLVLTNSSSPTNTTINPPSPSWVITFVNVTNCSNNCSCVKQTNATTRVTTWNCSCNTINSTNRTQVITTRGLIYNASQCSLNGTLYSCCVTSQVAVNTTITPNPPAPTIITVPVNVTTCQTNCSCVNQTNITTKVITWNCSCNSSNSTNRTQVITTRGLIFNATQCSLNGANYNCCVTNVVLMNVTVNNTNPSTPANTTIQVVSNVTSCQSSCSCVNQTNITTRVSTWNCSCNTTNSTNRTQIITTRGLIFNATQCSLNGTNYTCCVTTTVVQNVTVPVQNNTTTNATSNATRTNTTQNNSIASNTTTNVNRTNTTSNNSTGSNITTNVTRTNTTGTNGTITNSTSNSTSNSTRNNTSNSTSNSTTNTSSSVTSQCLNSTCLCTNVTVAPGKFVLNCSCRANLTTNVTVQGLYNLTSSSQCKCTNVSGRLNCDCCIPRNTLTIAENAQCSDATNTSSAYCTCVDVAFNASTNRTYKSCNCNVMTGPNSYVALNSMRFENASQCSCVNVTNGTSSYQLCTCCVSQSLVYPSVVQRCNASTSTQASCRCINSTNATTKQWYWNCSSCQFWNGTVNTVRSNLNLTNSSCSCINATVNGTVTLNCTCCVPGVSAPPQVLDDSTCDATNSVKRTNVALNATNCKYEYQYLVAVVATGKNSSFLLQLQSYQMDSAYYLKSAFASAILMIAYFLY